MKYAVVETENWDVLRTYDTSERAQQDLANRVARNPDMAPRLMVRMYHDGRPFYGVLSADAPPVRFIAERTEPS